MNEVRINWIPVIEYNSISIERSIDNFVDTFSCNLNNNGWLLSRKFPVGNTFSFIVEWVEVFRWLIETKKVNYWNVWNNLSIWWREELVFLTEDEISPTISKYKNTTDNYVIEQITSWFWWTLDLWESSKISEYEVSVWMKKWQIIEDVVKLNNFIVYKRGKTLYKKQRPTVAKPWKLKSTFRSSIEGWKFHNFNNRIISIDITEDISRCRSNIKGYTYTRDKSKSKIKDEIKNQYLLDWTYHKRLRNQVSWTWSNTRIQRLMHITAPVKDQKELNQSMKNWRVETDIKMEVSVVLYWFVDLDLLDTIDVVIESEWISQYMYITSIRYSFDKTNKFTSEIVMTPLIPNDIA